MYNRETRQWEWPQYAHLQDAVKRFFEILDIRETSDFDREFNPVRFNFDDATISSCRVVRTAELTDLLEQMKVLSGYRQIKEMQELNI